MSASVRLRPPRTEVAVDVLIPRYDEPVDVVDLTLAAAAGYAATTSAWLLDDGEDDEMAALAEDHGVGYIRRPVHDHAKAGTSTTRSAGLMRCMAIIGSRLRRRSRFSGGDLGHFDDDDRLAFADAGARHAGRLRAACPAPRGLSRRCSSARSRAARTVSTRPLLRDQCHLQRAALDEVGGFPTHSITGEDFEFLSIGLHERGWRSAYLPEGSGERARPRGHGLVRDLEAAALGASGCLLRCRASSVPGCCLASARNTCSRRVLAVRLDDLIYMSFLVVRDLVRRAAARRSDCTRSSCSTSPRTSSWR